MALQWKWTDKMGKITIKQKEKCYYIYEMPLNVCSSYQVVQAYKDWEKFPKKFKKQIEAHNVHQTA